MWVGQSSREGRSWEAHQLPLDGLRGVEEEDLMQWL